MSARKQLDRILKKIAADDEALSVATTRLASVLGAASDFPGVLRSFRSGSMATGFVNAPVVDADGGVVMDRRQHPELGPDGAGELPRALVENLRRSVGPALRRMYPNVCVEIMKRGLLVRFNDPLPSGEDPTVDMVVALNRRQDDALWIPNLDRNRWDPSHPERHVELFTAGWDSLQQTRRDVARLAKAQVKQFDVPAVCSFNIAVLAWECIELAEPIDTALHRFFDYAATELDKHLTKDPAEVSPPIKVANREQAVNRFRYTAEAIETAIDAGPDEEKVAEIFAGIGVFWKLVEAPSKSSAAIHQAIAAGGTLSIASSGSLHAGASPNATPIKPTRSYGRCHASSE